jgi:hypothetical protein
MKMTYELEDGTTISQIDIMSSTPSSKGQRFPAVFALDPWNSFQVEIISTILSVEDEVVWLFVCRKV